ncbi:unnamed protein product [Prorocentrum cordatum]|uniref:Uncharacterized protein n=1 Tax=Prorocentrum cordatum TaxID=2364126 RepID=A0ABN9XBB3_9DINO|nr:unnamed protein product [Polarella glacialis]
MAASRLLGATRCAALPAVGRRAITVVSRGPWSFEFEAKGAVLHAQYGLPPKLPCPQEAIAEWSGPIADEVRRGPTELMGSSSERNAACVLRFLDDVQSAAAGLARQERPMEALVLSVEDEDEDLDEEPREGATRQHAASETAPPPWGPWWRAWRGRWPGSPG